MVAKTIYKRPVRWGIIGCGDVTEVKSGPAYQKTEGFELVAVMRRNRSKVEDYARRHNIKKYYTDAEDLINDEEVDAIYVATPPDTHKLYGLKVAKAGKPCCIEKPMAPSYADSLVIQKAFEEKKLPLFIAYYRRSLPRFNQVNAWLKSNTIGEVRHINWQLSKPPSALDLSGAYNWRTDANVAPGGYFDDLASHGLDLFTHFLGNIVEVNGISSNQQQLYSAKDAIVANWLHEGDITGTGSWNFGSYQNEDSVEINGSRGLIRFSVFEETPIILKIGAQTQEIFIDNPINVQLQHVENMRDALLGKNFSHPSTGTTATHTSWVMDKILGRI